ncbi:peptidase S15 [Candidatus Koribacter versatilis Ellin345]|uniref:Peptidase S15 n=1 Tax=Koribacter versatilis (strain Ellin345) TaxID=204669 RepID=Q1IQE9_KORVE|nr:CocE/NonD family hydrolase [Candidatus Koribacter versatilis]ABF40901.1 peptidase S15 [Candidatus Koribacter versatilis Ellin345]
MRERFAVLILAALSFLAPVLSAGRATLPEQTYGGITIREQWIPMRDGVKLAANLFLPADLKPDEKVPVVLEYLPYRKDDWSLGRDYSLHGYLVRKHYVVARVDVRGTGRSEGRTPDREYSEQELQDGEEVIAWLARQAWSNGNVGMMGISWGGFNSIQMAMRRPPALKAIIAADASDDLFHDDIHYIDGMMHLDEFEISMDLTNSLSPAPDFPVDEKTLNERFDTPPWFLLYLKHQRDGEFWRRASLSTDYSRIEIPVFLIGGFLDGYRDSVPRMLANLKGPRFAIVGPWPHSFPHDAEPGPAVEWRDLETDWFDHWLKGKANDVEKWPMLRVFMRDYYKPGLETKEIPGEWKATEWPTKSTAVTLYPYENLTMYVQYGKQEVPWFKKEIPGGYAWLGRAYTEQKILYQPDGGIEAGLWWGDLTVDQRPSDEKSLPFQSPVLERDLAILGIPEVRLHATTGTPLANWFVRLEDLAPNGSTTLVTGAGLSGAQRNSRTAPSPPAPGQSYDLTIPLHFTSWVFPAGHRVRISVSNSLWPMIWPTPYSMTNHLRLPFTERTNLTLPVIESANLKSIEFAKPQESDSLPSLRSEGDLLPGTSTVTRDEAKHTTTVDWHGEERDFYPFGEEETKERLVHTVNVEHPAEASVHGEASMAVKLKDRTLLWSTTLNLRSDEKNFYYEYTRELRNDGKLIRTKTWRETVPRDFQ